jgi:hypothetical protein
VSAIEPPPARPDPRPIARDLVEYQVVLIAALAAARVG